MNNKVNQTSFKKGHKPTEKVRQKISLAKLGSIPWNKGNTGGIGTRIGTRIGTYKPCLVCKKEIYIEPNQNVRKKFCSKECLYVSGVQLMTFKKGAEHPAWIDGTARNGYTSDFSPKLKNKIRIRDNFICQLCGITEEEHKNRFGRNLCVNHIDFNKSNCDEKNLNTLCNGCNIKINWDRQKWTNYFNNKVMNI